MATNAELAKSNKALKAQRNKTKRVEEECDLAIAAVHRDTLMRKLIGKGGGVSGARALGAWSHKSETVGGDKLKLSKSVVVAGLGYLGALGAAVVTKGENAASAFVEGMGDSGLYVWQYESQRRSMRSRDASNEGTVTMGEGERLQNDEPVRTTGALPHHVGAADVDPDAMQRLMEQVRAEAFEEGARAQAEEIERQMHSSGAGPFAPTGPAHGPAQVAGAGGFAAHEAGLAEASDAADGVT